MQRKESNIWLYFFSLFWGSSAGSGGLQVENVSFLVLTYNGTYFIYSQILQSFVLNLDIVTNGVYGRCTRKMCLFHTFPCGRNIYISSKSINSTLNRSWNRIMVRLYSNLLLRSLLMCIEYTRMSCCLSASRNIL